MDNEPRWLWAMKTEETKLLSIPLTSNHNDIGPEWYVTVRWWPKPWALQHAIIILEMVRLWNSAQIIIIMVIIIMQVPSFQCNCCTWDCRSLDREWAICIHQQQHRTALLCSVNWWNYSSYLSLSRLIWVCESVQESSGHRFNFDRQICHIHCTFSLIQSHQCLAVKCGKQCVHWVLSVEPLKITYCTA